MNLKLFVILFYMEYVSSVESYRYLKLYDRDVCPNADIFSTVPLPKPLKEFLDSPKKLQLQDGQDSAVVLEQKFSPRSFRKSFEINCVFKIDATRRNHNKGLFIVIRKLNFRMKNSEQCRDYIKIEYSNHTKSEKICGTIDRNGPLRSYIDGSGKVKVEIHIDTKTPLEPDEEDVEFSIIFTGYAQCDENRVSCFSNAEKNIVDDQFCITKDFWGDGIPNCPFDCLDESGCQETQIESILQPSNIILSALTSLVFTMVLFGSCIWVLWKYRECTDGRRDLQRAQRDCREATIEMQVSDTSGQSSSVDNRNSNNTSRTPTAPLSDGKDDLPPAYDQLFPER